MLYEGLDLVCVAKPSPRVVGFICGVVFRRKSVCSSEYGCMRYLEEAQVPNTVAWILPRMPIPFTGCCNHIAGLQK